MSRLVPSIELQGRAERDGAANEWLSGVPIVTGRRRGVLTNGLSPYMIVPAGSTATQVNAASAALKASGGTVILQAGSYVGDTAVVPVSGVSIIGVQTQLLGNLLIDGQWTPIGGTIFTSSGGTTNGLQYNNTNLGSPPSPWAPTALNNVTLDGLCFSGYTNGIVIGAVNNPGMNGCNIRNLVAYNCSGWGMIFKNFGGVRADQLWANQCLVGGIKAQHATLQQSLGNSYWQGMHIDLTQQANPNFASGFVAGADPTVPGALANQFKFQNIEVFAFAGRTTITDTAVCTSGQAAFTVSNGANFPVGMPVQFAPSNAFTGYLAFFVLTQVGNTITVGKTRSGAAVLAGQTTSPTITQTGMPLVDIYNPSNSSFTGIDAEGPGIACVYGEALSSCDIQILELTTPAANVGNVTLRISNGPVRVSCLNGVAVADFDSQSGSKAQYFGALQSYLTNANCASLASYYDTTNSFPSFNVSNKSGNGFGNTPDLVGTSSGTLLLSTPLAQPEKSFTAGTSQAIAWNQAGITSLEVTAISQSFVLPQLVASATKSNSTAGQPLLLVNPGNQATPQTCTIAPFGTAGTGQKIVYLGTQYATGISLPSGATCSLRAMQNSAGSVSWWQVEAVTGVVGGTGPTFS